MFKFDLYSCSFVSVVFFIVLIKKKNKGGYFIRRILIGGVKNLLFFVSY